MPGAFDRLVRAITVCQVLSGATLLLGIAIVAFATLYPTVRPYALLDVVLTPDELRDDTTRVATLALLQKIPGHHSIAYASIGLVLVLIAVMLLFFLDRVRHAFIAIVKR